MAKKSITSFAFPREKGFSWYEDGSVKYLVYKGIIVSMKRVGYQKECFSFSLVIEKMELPYPEYYLMDNCYFCKNPKLEIGYDVLEEDDALRLQADVIAWLEPYAERWKDYLKDDVSQYRNAWKVAEDLKDAPYAHTAQEVRAYMYRIQENFSEKYPKIRVDLWDSFREAVLDRQTGNVIEERKIVPFDGFSKYSMSYYGNRLPSDAYGIESLIDMRNKYLDAIREINKRIAEWQKADEAEKYWKELYRGFTEYALELKH